MRRLSFVLLALSLLMVALPLLGQSQATTGVIEGTVVDASGAAVPGVTLTVKNIATGYETIVVTDAAGRFRAVLLPLGPYQVTASLQGFATVVQKGLDLGVGQTLTVNIALKQATAAESLPEPDALRNLHARIFEFQLIPVTPRLLLPTAPNVPDVCVPWP